MIKNPAEYFQESSKSFLADVVSINIGYRSCMYASEMYTDLELWSPMIVLELWSPLTVLQLWSPLTVLELWSPLTVLELWSPLIVLELWSPLTVLELLFHVRVNN